MKVWSSLRPDLLWPGPVPSGAVLVSKTAPVLSVAAKVAFGVASVAVRIALPPTSGTMLPLLVEKASWLLPKTPPTGGGPCVNVSSNVLAPFVTLNSSSAKLNGWVTIGEMSATGAVGVLVAVTTWPVSSVNDAWTRNRLPSSPSAS